MTPSGTVPSDAAFDRSTGHQVSQPGYMDMNLAMDGGEDMERAMNTAGLFQGRAAQEGLPNLLGDDNEVIGGLGNTFSWEMIGLGLDEPLPTQDVIDDLSGFPVYIRMKYFADEKQASDILREVTSCCADDA